ncbi:hypothetical protein [Kitasatospora cinereorecta]
MPAGSSPERERRYEHVKETAEKRGTSEKREKIIRQRSTSGLVRTSKARGTGWRGLDRRGVW